ncbi:hypothetical protein BOTBODRAFT_45773 [Botryobasidium botryosum FD-172 SS1]|uniref:Uncharacterized protein n=1 Tax=Botryobasidium botryosum (strain FD-172 SS1) TaxID=930990 RepID=A0A067MA25_BOTB1|nr:hypothetical protein BOTBODRAFT_45773 [Botryobasidium botryosum FD-172 SS1]
MISVENRPVTNTVERTLEQFNEIAAALDPELDDNDAANEGVSREYVRFTTQGRANQSPQEPLTVFNVFEPLLPEDLPELKATRDYDSLVGWSHCLDIASGLLTLHIHADLSRPMKVMHGITYPVPSADPALVTPANVGEIPNYEFATIGDKVSFKLALPALYDRAGGLRVEEREAAAVYDHAIRPSVPRGILQHFPPSYDAETVRDRHHDGRVALSKSHTLTPFEWAEVQDGMLDRFEDDPHLGFARGAFFLVEVKGAKLSRVQQLEPGMPLAPAPLAEDIREWLPWLDLDHEAWQGANLFVDVAQEYRIAKTTVHWRCDSHARILAHALGQDAGVVRAKLTRAFDRTYFQDESALLSDLAGLRWSCADHENELGIVKFNVYTTDKSVAYLPDRGRYAKFIDAKDALLRYIDGSGSHPTSRFISGMGLLYDTAREADQPGTARFEVRLPVRNAGRALVEPLPDNILMDALVPINADVPSRNYKTHRLLGLGVLLTWTTVLPFRLRVRPGCLTLVAACCFLLNALNSCPDSWLKWRELLESILPLVSRHGALEAARQGKTTWLHHVLLDGPDAPAGMPFPQMYRSASSLTLRDIFGVASIKALQHGNDIDRKRRHPMHAEGDRPLQRHNTRRRMVEALPGVVPDIADIPSHARVSLAGIGPHQHLVERMPSCLLQKSLVPQGGDSSVVDPDMGSSHDFFKIPAEAIPSRFRGCQIRLWQGHPPEKYWEIWTTCFTKCFPVRPEDASGKAQCYRQMLYYGEWVDFVKSQPEEVALAVRDRILVQFDRYTWFPAAAQDRPWPAMKWTVPTIGKPYLGAPKHGEPWPRGPCIMTRPKGKRPTRPEA